MELSELEKLLQGNPIEKDGQVIGNQYNEAAYVKKIMKQWKQVFQNKSFEQYNPEFHAVVKDKIIRKDKEIFVPTGETNTDGTPAMRKETVRVARLPVPLQRIIVSRAAQFLTGGKITLACQPANDVEKNIVQGVNDIWKYNKLQYKNTKIAKAMMSELEAVELWYSIEEEGKPVEMRMNILTPSMGFEFYPVFDAIGNLIAFGIWYKVDSIEYFDLYTPEEKRSHIKGRDTANQWKLNADAEGGGIIELPYGKIPIIYYMQDLPEWHGVQRLIDRYESLISNFADINDYNGSPVLFLKGKGMSLPTKGQAGKVIQNEDGTGDAKYVTWDQAPEAIKLEIETLANLIYSMTQTAPIDFENMKGLGDLSGVAFDRVLIDSHLKAREKQNDVYGECIQRRINFLIAAVISIDKSLASGSEINIIPEFDIFRIDDVNDRIQTITQANGGNPVIDIKTGIKLAGLAGTDEDQIEEVYNNIIKEMDSLGGATSGGL